RGAAAAVPLALTFRTPEGRAVAVALSARGDPPAAARAGPTYPVVHPQADREPALGRLQHPRPHGVEHRHRFGVGHPPRWPPGVEADLPAALGLRDVPDPRDVALVVEGVADPPGGSVRPDPRQDPVR